MSNGSEACCALGICCPPNSSQQRKAIVQIIMDETTCGEVEAGKISDLIVSKFALAPKSLELFIEDVVKMVLAHPPHGV